MKQNGREYKQTEPCPESDFLEDVKDYIIIRLKIYNLFKLKTFWRF